MTKLNKYKLFLRTLLIKIKNTNIYNHLSNKMNSYVIIQIKYEFYCREMGTGWEKKPILKLRGTLILI